MKQNDPLWFFNPAMQGLGIRGLIIQFDSVTLSDSERAYYPNLVCHRAKNETQVRGKKTKSVHNQTFYFNDKYWASDFRIAVKIAYKTHLKFHGIHDSDTLKEELEAALKYVGTEEFFERVHSEIINKSKSLKGGLKAVRFYPRWVKNAVPTGVTFSNLKSTNRFPTLELNNVNLKDEKLKCRKNIHDYRSLFLWSANYVARLIRHNSEIEDVALEYAMGIYWMLKGDWYRKAVSYGFEVGLEESRYNLNLTYWLERIDIEYGFINSDRSKTILGVTPNSLNKPFDFTIEDQLETKSLVETIPRKHWLAVIHSFGDRTFIATEVKQFLSEIGYDILLTSVTSRLIRDCEVVSYTDKNGRPGRQFKALKSI
ncbi:hypothetical protein VB319_25255 [Vibrio parahaemolyticus]|nr:MULTISPECIES: hypothetical protein [Vibrio]MDW1965805.1 hypothetical protein [Vibrio sp. Vb0587]MEA5357238.1 hypothetical protein [Vibrio parahaemolyticus]RFD38009.1 hypothetical protein BS585_14340 [Vibrio parahaemolyticus]HAT8520666.1 hypothetical protein [Vibrio vulnificus]